MAIFVLIAAQPSQASLCDMCDGQETSHSQHDNMNGGDMDGMDCCDHDSAELGDGCESMSHCGACTVGLVAISPATFNAIHNPGSLQYPMTSNGPLSNSSPPPFRPPIA